MTALKPLDQHDIRAVSDHDEERKLLRRAVLNPVCAHPECDSTEVEGHHVWPRSFISNSSWYVRIPGQDKPILHVTGLCRTHHADVEEHRSWIKYGSLESNTPEEMIFGWYSRGPEDTWAYLGPLAPQPGQIQHVKKARKKRDPQKKRNRVNVTIGVPLDERENGAGILDDLIGACREHLQPELGWSEDVPAYFVITASLAKALQT